VQLIEFLGKYILKVLNIHEVVKLIEISDKNFESPNYFMKRHDFYGKDTIVFLILNK
jgi:hypothetical protein